MSKRLLILCAAVEGVLFGWLCTLPTDAFWAFVSDPDPAEYWRVARHLAASDWWLTTSRTLGYPAFLALCQRLGGAVYGAHVAIALQLLLNLGLTGLCWRLLQRLAPSVGERGRFVAALFCFWAGMGMALMLMSDFLSALLFAVFVYGLLFWRRHRSLWISGTALALATWVRPTLMVIPLLLPLMAWCVARVTSRVPVGHLVVFAVCILAATGASTAYQYAADGYLGPSSIVAQNVGRTVVFATLDGTVTGNDYPRFIPQIEARAGAPDETLSRREVQQHAMRIFFETLWTHPKPMLALMGKTFVKYLCVPVEFLVQQLTTRVAGAAAYEAVVRPIIALGCLPVWLLALWPPGRARRYWAYYLLMLLLWFYLAGITMVNPYQGERIRFPVLMLMLPVVLWNAQSILQRLRGGLYERIAHPA